MEEKSEIEEQQGMGRGEIQPTGEDRSWHYELNAQMKVAL